MYIDDYRFKKEFKADGKSISFISMSFVKYDEFASDYGDRHGIIIKCAPIVDPHRSRDRVDADYTMRLSDSSLNIAPVFYIHRGGVYEEEGQWGARSYGYALRYRGNWYGIPRSVVRHHEMGNGYICEDFKVPIINRCSSELCEALDDMMKEMFSDD